MKSVSIRAFYLFFINSKTFANVFAAVRRQSVRVIFNFQSETTASVSVVLDRLLSAFMQTHPQIVIMRIFPFW